MGKIYLTAFLFFITSTAVFNQTLEDSLAAYYNFNNTLNDASGNIKHITEAEGAFTADRFGSPNAAFHFDGENDSLVLPVDKFAPITGDFAISFWYKTNSSAIMNLFSSKQSPDDTTQNFEIQLNSHNRFYLEYYKQVWYQTYVYWNGTGIESNALAEGVAGNFIKGEWSHFVISREADTFKIYRNHQLYYLSINTYFADELGDAINMVFSAMPYRFKGDIDDLRLYKRALSQQDIDLLWFENNPIQFVNPQATDAYVFGSNVLVYWEYDTTQISDSIMVTYSINNGAWINADHSGLAFENYTYVDMSFAPGTTVEVRVEDRADSTKFQQSGQFIVSPYIWTEVTDALPFPAKDGSGLVAFKNKMWLLGGWDPPFHEPNYTHNEVWSSTDGENWNFETNAAWPPRHCAAWLSNTDNIWVIGGDPQSGCLTDVWNSPDGINWVQIIDTIPGYTKRNMPNYAILNDKLTLFGGEQCSGLGLNDVWQSDNGESWNKLPDAPWSGRGMQINSCVDDNGFMWMLSGANEGERRPFNEVWNTADGITWNLINPSAPWMGRYWHTVAWFDNNIWVMGGITAGIELNDVWYSPDGINWRELKTTTGNLPEGTRHAQSTTVFDNALWYMCGISTNNVWKITNQFNEVAIPELAETTRLLISPNPTTNKCLIQFDESDIGRNYIVTNTLGEIMLRGKINASQQIIDLSNFNTGLFYFVIYDLSPEVGIIVKQ